MRDEEESWLVGCCPRRGKPGTAAAVAAAAAAAAAVQDVLKAAADDKGEWYLPLDEQQVGGSVAQRSAQLPRTSS
jgi:opacity protein-like surface antigen